ncbi:MAG TPA: hypothetical protein VMS64_24840 [Candidatus Methylomirabilis sp.]|nr:hypothetical protein [Candidatus Methylomirabilis sp.]
MRGPVGLGTPCRVAMLVLLAGLAVNTTAWGQAAGPFDTFTVTPCRVLDTRVASGLPLLSPPGPSGTVGGPLAPIPAGGYLPIIVNGDLTAGGTVHQGGMPNCNVPDNAMGAFVNVVAVNAGGAGWLTVYPSNTNLPNASTLNFSTGQTVANGILVPVCTPANSCLKDLNINMGPFAGAHVVVDITGYLMPTQ